MAIWKKLFSKITFKDYPDTSTPLNATNLNAMTDAIDGIDDRVVELNSNLENNILYKIVSKSNDTSISLKSKSYLAKSFSITVDLDYYPIVVMDNSNRNNIIGSPIYIDGNATTGVFTVMMAYYNNSTASVDFTPTIRVGCIKKTII